MSEEPTFGLNYVKALQDEIARERTRAEAAERELAELRERTQGVCHWRLVDDDWNAWEGDCGVTWQFDEGNPEENEMKYCPNCGKRLEQMPLPVPPEADND